MSTYLIVENTQNTLLIFVINNGHIRHCVGPYENLGDRIPWIICIFGIYSQLLIHLTINQFNLLNWLYLFFGSHKLWKFVIIMKYQFFIYLKIFCVVLNYFVNLKVLNELVLKFVLRPKIVLKLVKSQGFFIDFSLAFESYPGFAISKFIAIFIL